MNGNVKLSEYFFDSEGKRVKKNVYNTDGATLKEVTVFVYSAGKLVAEYSTNPPPQNPTTNYTATDQLSSPRVITNALGAVVSRRDFMPFGEELAPDPTYRKTDLKYTYGDDIRQKFKGFQKDEESGGPEFAQARYYDTKHGRFTSVDPLTASANIKDPQTFNRYRYAMNSPIRWD
jgi:RHS repeat-associated protein